jgi:dihydroorotate dehydrogenase (fumarate)
MKLCTNYLGFSLRTPLVAAASPLSQEFDNIKRMEDAGASAIVFHSLFEEEIRTIESCLDNYLTLIARAKQAVSIPIIGSVNGATFGGWMSAVRQIAQAGADALELNVYSVPTDPNQCADDIESDYLAIVASVKAQLKVPVAVKISPFFTSVRHFAQRLDRVGADGLVVFNQFPQPDLNLESREVTPNVVLSTSSAMRLPLRWIAILRGRVSASLAASGGIHHATDVLKMLMAGADVTMLCSALLSRGIQQIRTIERDMCAWMDEHDYESVAQIKGCMSQMNCSDPAVYERAQYVQAITTARSRYSGTDQAAKSDSGTRQIPVGQ